MFETLTRLFGQNQEQATRAIEPDLAVAAILVHLAAVDGEARPEELKMISGTLQSHYGLSDGEVKKLVAEARRKDNEAVDFYQFTAALAKLDKTERLAIIRMMWQVAFADKTNHEMEDNTVWRVAELLGVSARERTVLRSQMRTGLGLPEDYQDQDIDPA